MRGGHRDSYSYSYSSYYYYSTHHVYDNIMFSHVVQCPHTPLVVLLCSGVSITINTSLPVTWTGPHNGQRRDAYDP